jgi:HK97 family phage prohead protease
VGRYEKHRQQNADECKGNHHELLCAHRFRIAEHSGRWRIRFAAVIGGRRPVIQSSSNAVSFECPRRCPGQPAISFKQDPIMLAPSDFVRPGATIAPDGTVEGYASLFGEIDQARDMVMPGAFERSLKLRGVRRVPMLFQHDPAEPVGVWLELREDARGLYARGRLIPEVARGRELLALLRAGTADGLSIGFRTVKGRLDPKTRIRKLDVIDLWEISIVTFPLLAEARLVLASKAQSSAHSRASGNPGPKPSPSNVVLGPRFRGDERTGAIPAGGASFTRNSWPVDRSLLRFKPERLFRKEPRLRIRRESEIAATHLTRP